VKPDRWLEVERLYHAALERDPEGRAAFLAEASGGDEELLDEVRSLLDQHSGDSRLDRAVWEPGGESTDTPFAAGTQLGQYTIEAPLGAGGMGEVFRARDTRLNRTVAIKISKRSFTGRFKREAQAVAALNHPNIVQIHELGSEDGDDFIVMEFVPGRTLAELLRVARLSLDQALEYANQIASALAAAHAAGIVHRDIKPGNIIVSDAGVVKILDFGLAKVEQVAVVRETTVTVGARTGAGTVVGTPAYMSPEQAEGKAVDARSDIFSTGALFYEMLTGRRAFDADSTLGVLSKVLRETPRGIRELRPEAPRAVARIVARCLEKDPALRYASGKELAGELMLFHRPPRAALTGRTGMLIAAALIAVISLSGWMYYRNWRARWTRDEALPRIRSLVAKGDYVAAFDLTRAALRYVPDDPQLKQHWSEISLPMNLTSTPPGAKVLYKPYGEAGAPWRLVGETPFASVPMPAFFMQIRVEKKGFEPAEFATHGVVLLGQNIPLSPAGSVPAGMVMAPARPSWLGPLDVMPLPDYFLDKFEVTNRQFKQFVDAGGYRDPKYWRHPFRKDGRDISLEQAMTLLRDATGRPGPSGWELGAFPKDQSDFPVSGVSWFEAAAYCEFGGKALPTVHHWRKVAAFSLFSEILRFSNFGGVSPSRVGAYTGISGLGAYDMAGNVKEWCWNSFGERRATLGGGWNEPSYMFRAEDAQDPFTRPPSYGFRCALYAGQVPAEAFAPISHPVRDYLTQKPVSDGVFEIFRSMYAYDKTPLDAKTERVDESNEYFRKEKVSYRAAYGDERIPAFLYLPRNARPPYQAVLWAPGGYATLLRSSETGWPTEYFKFLLRTGRAVLYPVYKGTFERRIEAASGPSASRDATIQYVKDAFRSVDFLESRPDIRRASLGFYVLSTSPTSGIILALEPRLKAGVLVSCGLWGDKPPPEVDLFNFAPRVRAPTLMLNGRDDFIFPPATSQQPLFRLLGTPASDKRYVQLDGGHATKLQDIMPEVLDWFDRYLGPVETNR
jgi:tRNA A-37 threonylcarbamoyl transferase component Bud32/pimeloyl-ACP methyl ester carboxylesterase